MRLTESIRTAILVLNEGFHTRTSFDSRNSKYIREYIIKEGKLLIKEMGKTSWSDSHYSKEWIADKDEIIRFLHNNINTLKKP